MGGLNWAAWAFLGLSAAALVSAVLVITRRNAVHSAMWLIVRLFSVGGVFLVLRAEFLFAVHVIIYVGGIMVLFLFVIMLVNLDVAVKQRQFSRQWPVALVTVGLLALELGYGLYHGTSRLALAPAALATPVMGNTEAVGTALYQDYMLAVEIASILLLVAMIGAVLMAKRKLE
jgi:NADH-quinone oxidoreductase subunit J